jgi:predicted RNase H-like HicB family nuclease
MTTLFFPAIIERGKASYGVFFPDLPGCVSAGRTAQEAARNAEEALSLHLEGMVEERLTIPPPSELDRIAVDPEIREAARILVRAEVPARAQRVNITMDERLLAKADRVAAEAGLTRSGYLAQLVNIDLRRRTTPRTPPRTGRRKRA